MFRVIETDINKINMKVLFEQDVCSIRSKTLIEMLNKKNCIYELQNYVTKKKIIKKGFWPFLKTKVSYEYKWETIVEIKT